MKIDPNVYHVAARGINGSRYHADFGYPTEAGAMREVENFTSQERDAFSIEQTGPGTRLAVTLTTPTGTVRTWEV